MSPQNVSRRDFIRQTATTGVVLGTLGAPSLFAQESGEPLKVALVGCGGRGRGALINCLSAAEHLQINMVVTAVADAFSDRALGAGQQHGLPPERCHAGFAAYREIMASDADIVLLATPPNFRPIHLAAAVEAGKHVFIEKPVAVDPPGARSVMASGEAAAAKGLAIVAGTQRRHDPGYVRNQKMIEQGALGDITGGAVYWCGGALWRKNRRDGETDAEYMVRNWVNFTEMSGDHIVEQHVHNLDVANWFIGRVPEAAMGFGGRAQRRTGNQYDFFSIDFDYGAGCHVHSMCRQVNGTYGRVSEFFSGAKGSVWGSGKMKPASLMEGAPLVEGYHQNPYVQEHVALLQGIQNGQPLNEAHTVAESTLTGIMGRIAAYTGQLVRWVDVAAKTDSPWYDLRLTPTAEDFEKGPVTAPEEEKAPVPGNA